MSIRRVLVAVTPPIVATGVRRALVRLGRRPVPPPAAPAEAPAPEPAVAVPEPAPPTQAELERPTRPEPEPPEAPPAPPPEWEYVPEGFARAAGGWDGGTVGEAYAEKWSDWVDAIRAPAPLGVYHESISGSPLPREDLSAHNMLLTFAYVVARAAYGRKRLSVLDWGGGLGHYAPLARSVMPEVELEWHCREVPSVAHAGAEVVPDVTFHDDDSCLDRRYDLVVASGSLQYEEDWQGLLRRFARATRAFLLVTRLPIAFRAPSFVILQRAHPYGYATEYSGWVVSRPELLQTASAAGLELERELLLEASLSGLGAPEEPILHRGFLFRAVAEGA